MAVATGVGSVFPDHFIYHSIDAVDAATEDLRQYFDEALNFIRNAIEKSGKVRKIRGCLENCICIDDMGGGPAQNMSNFTNGAQCPFMT